VARTSFNAARRYGLLAAALGDTRRGARGCSARAQLVWRQPRRHSCARSPRRAPSIRLLRGPRARHRRHDSADRRACALGLHDSRDCALGARRLSARDRRGVSRDHHARCVQDVVVRRRSNGAANTAGDRNAGTARQSSCVVRIVWTPAALRHGRPRCDSGTRRRAAVVGVEKQQRPGDARAAAGFDEPRV
jgi:hypothetical protein